jgi:hypothetical protein
MIIWQEILSTRREKVLRIEEEWRVFFPSTTDESEEKKTRQISVENGDNERGKDELETSSDFTSSFFN